MSTTPFSTIISGAMTWGVWGKNCNTLEMIELIRCCLENNITTFDHADIYGHYTTEAAFGVALKESRFDRSNMQLISKCGIQMPSETRNTAIKHYNYSTAHIVWSVEESLKNLQTDYLDLLLLHRPSPLMNTDHICEAIEKLTKEGKILDFGLSNFNPLQTDLIETKIKVSYNQIEFSLTHSEAMFNGSLDHMQIHQITPMCWSPLGTFFRKNDEPARRVKEIIVTLAAKYDVPDEVILLAWILKHPAGILPVCGTTTPARIAVLKKATAVEMELQDWFALLSASVGTEVA